jgi:hypothetical protein
VTSAGEAPGGAERIAGYSRGESNRVPCGADSCALSAGRSQRSMSGAFIRSVAGADILRFAAPARAAGGGFWTAGDALGASRETMLCPIVKDSNFSGPFGVIDLEAFKVKSSTGRMVSLAEVIKNPEHHASSWNGPDQSFFSTNRTKRAGEVATQKDPKRR